MAETTAVIAARLRLAYPAPQYATINGEPVEMSPADYDQWVTDQAVAVREQQVATEAEAVEAEIRRQARLAMTKLEANDQLLADTTKTLTGPQQRTMLADVTRATHFLIRILGHAGIIEA